jgi:HD-GYP domain-containing protein (c-di-GMP phosphodiesterase class II)
MIEMEYVPLRINTVKANTSLTFDLYIYFKDHYLCYVNKGESIEEGKLVKLIDQEIADFFVPSDQVDNVSLFMDEVLKEAVLREDLSTEERVDAVEGVAATSAQHMNENPTESNYKMTQKAALGLRQVIKSNPDALKRLFGKKAKESDQIISHSLNVCGLVTKLAEILKFKEDEIDDLATAALIHDIGLTKLPEEHVLLFSEKKEEFTPEQRLKYGSHTKVSAALLEDKPYISKRVEELIINHEENLQGTGPLKVKKLTPMQECLCLVNAYDKRVSTYNEKPSEAFKSFQLDNIGLYNLEMIQKFGDVLKEEGLLE